MSTTQTNLFPPPTRTNAVDDKGFLAIPLRQWLFSLQMLLPLRVGNSSKGSYSEALPPAGLNATTGQSNQNEEIIYIKGSSDANTWTITGVKSGNVALSSQYELARFKSDGTNWWNTGVSSGVSSLALEVNGTPNIDQALLNLFAGSGITITDAGSGKIVIAASGSVATGLPIIPLPGGSPGGGAGLPFNPISQLAAGGSTTWEFFTGRGLLNLASRWTVTVNNAAGSGIAVSSMNLAKCTQDTGTVVATIPITFGSLSSFVWAPGDNTSDAISFAFDPTFDYCFRFYIPGSGTLTLWQGSGSCTNMPGGVAGSSANTDYTAANPIVITGLGSVFLGNSVIKKFVSA